MGTRRERRLTRLRKQRVSSNNQVEVAEPVEKSRPEGTHKNVFDKIYDQQYKKLTIIPITLLLLAFIVIGMNIASTGDFINKGVSLKGGLTITVPSGKIIDVDNLELSLTEQFSYDIVVRGLSELTVQKGVIIEAGVEPELRDSFLSAVSSLTDVSQTEFSIEEIGSSLGSSFFKQTMFAVLFAFIFMGLVVFLYFRTFVPSLAVILAAFSDIVITIAVIDLMGMRIGTAGIAAFLMLIGYSVDTDILLSTRVLKRTEGTIMNRIYGAMRTGLTMNFSTIAAVTAALFISDSEIIKQIMTIILIGLLVDIIMTWIQNVSILRYYLEKKHGKV